MIWSIKQGWEEELMLVVVWNIRHWNEKHHMNKKSCPINCSNGTKLKWAWKKLERATLNF